MDLLRSGWINVDVEYLSRAGDDEAEIFVGVEVEAQHDAEARAKGCGEESGARGGGDEGKGRDLHSVRASRGALSDDDVELAVFQRGVEDLFERGLQAVHFVEEEDLLGADVGEDGGEVALDLQSGAGGLLVFDAHLVG